MSRYGYISACYLMGWEMVAPFPSYDSLRVLAVVK